MEEDAKKIREENKARIDAAYGEGAHAEIAQMITPQLCIVLLKRLGGKVDIPVAEMDDTGQDLMAMKIENNTFTFVIEKKS